MFDNLQKVLQGLIAKTYFVNCSRNISCTLRTFKLIRDTGKGLLEYKSKMEIICSFQVYTYNFRGFCQYFALHIVVMPLKHKNRILVNILTTNKMENK